ncbi:MAG: cell division protein FtsZ [Flavobacteriales bacterium]
MESNKSIIANFDLPRELSSIIKVIGVGGGGSNAVNHMHRQGIKGVDFIICNTDQQALDSSNVPVKIQLGNFLTEGRGAGANPEIGREAAKENLDELRELLKQKTKMVFITAGMGGGTGTGAAPVIAGLAKEMGILTVGIVTYPFKFEGKRRIEYAQTGIDELKKNVDTLIVISNEKLRELSKDQTMTEAFAKADNVLTIAAKGIAEIITVTGYINVDFADVYTVMKDGGSAIMGSGSAEGQSRAMDAVRAALNSPLLNDNRIKGAKHVLINITSGKSEVTMEEMCEISDYVQEEAGQTANIILGTGSDESLENKLSVTVIATGFQAVEENQAPVVHQLASPVANKPIENKIVNEEPVLKSQLVVGPDREELRMMKRSEDEVPEELQITLKYKDSTDETAVNHEQELNRQAEERRLRMKMMHDNIPGQKMSPPLPTSQLEDIPAYLRRNIKLSEVSTSDSTKASRYTLTDNPETKNLDIRANNNFLHDNPD